MYTQTITRSELKEGDLLFFRPSGLFWYLIGIWSRIKDKRFTGVAFSHVGSILENDDNQLLLYDATVHQKTGFRYYFHKAYVFRLKDFTEKEKYLYKHYLLSRRGSLYDDPGIVSFAFPMVHEDEFRDYCSEMVKNWLVASGKIKDVERIEPYELYKLLRPKLDFIWLII